MLLSSFNSTLIIIPLEAYLAREIRLIKTIEVLKLKEDIVVVKCAIAFDVSQQTLYNR